jgi:hypothetical protein
MTCGHTFGPAGLPFELLALAGIERVEIEGLLIWIDNR